MSDTPQTPPSADPSSNPNEPPRPDKETVFIMGSYRVGYLPPVTGSLAVGELFIELLDEGGASRMWVGNLKTKDNAHGMTVAAGDKVDPRPLPKEELAAPAVEEGPRPGAGAPPPVGEQPPDRTRLVEPPKENPTPKENPKDEPENHGSPRHRR